MDNEYPDLSKIFPVKPQRKIGFLSPDMGEDWDRKQKIKNRDKVIQEVKEKVNDSWANANMFQKAIWLIRGTSNIVCWNMLGYHPIISKIFMMVQYQHVTMPVLFGLFYN